jgi:hypothetical protein
MDQALQVVVEMCESIWQGLRRDLQDMSPDEANWRPLPQANSINLIVRHLRIEAQWHRDCLERGEAMPHETTEALRREIDGVPLDFAANLDGLETAYTACVDELRTIALAELRERTASAYRAWPSCSPHFLGFHQAMHVCMHWGQIRTIRNLYRTSRGETARFFPDNPTFPKAI